MCMRENWAWKRDGERETHDVGADTEKQAEKPIPEIISEFQSGFCISTQMYIYKDKKRMRHEIRNIIFDCNGTMIFDGKYHDIAWRTYVSKLAGRELTKEEFQHQILGHTNRDIFEWLLGKGALSEEKIMQLTEEKEVLYRSMYQEDQDACRLVKGLPEFLDELQRRNINAISQRHLVYPMSTFILSGLHLQNGLTNQSLPMMMERCGRNRHRICIFVRWSASGRSHLRRW